MGRIMGAGCQSPLPQCTMFWNTTPAILFKPKAIAQPKLGGKDA
jgi:hypothetical protein